MGDSDGGSCAHSHRNIAHAFFQPADNEMITLVHFNLRDPIMVAKKKTSDVQASVSAHKPGSARIPVCTCLP